MKILALTGRILKIAILFCIFFAAYTSDANAAGKNVTRVISENYTIAAPAGITDFYCHTIDATGNITSTPIAVIKTTCPGAGDIVHLNQQCYRSPFSLSLFFTSNLLVRHRKSDIIFPFHYFW